MRLSARGRRRYAQQRHRGLCNARCNPLFVCPLLTTLTLQQFYTSFALDCLFALLLCRQLIGIVEELLTVTEGLEPPLSVESIAAKLTSMSKVKAEYVPDV